MIEFLLGAVAGVFIAVLVPKVFTAAETEVKTLEGKSNTLSSVANTINKVL